MSRTVLEILLKTAFAAAESIVQKKFCCCYYLVKGIVYIYCCATKNI